MVVRFDVREGPAGWLVIDRLAQSEAAATVDGVAAEGLDEEEAGEIADLLNTLAFLRRGAVVH